ncbi:MAG: sulfotransferase [Omnitrophica bacterium]|nr:sulfotransferase [Candidatus Omnitrophota bacterium]
MIMGVQRSGSTALLRSFAKNCKLVTLDEGMDTPVFQGFNLRPESEIRELLKSIKATVVFKSINETNRRNVEDVIQEYKNYDLWILWIYRDPVNVFYSDCKMSNRPLSSVYSFISQWNQRNQYILSAYWKYNSKIVIVKYEDLLSDPKVFFKICRLLNVKGRYIFYRDSSKGRKDLPDRIKDDVDKGTLHILTKLDKNRRFVSKINFPTVLLRILLRMYLEIEKYKSFLKRIGLRNALGAVYKVIIGKKKPRELWNSIKNYLY